MKKLLTALLVTVFAVANVNTVACGGEEHAKTPTEETKANHQASNAEQTIQCKNGKGKKQKTEEKAEEKVEVQQ